MAKLGISTGSSPNDGTGDSLIDGAVKTNSNFNEIYTAIGDGTTLAVPVTSVAAGTGINLSGSTGSVTITNTGIANTNNLRTDFLEVSGISTFQNVFFTNPSSNSPATLQVETGAAGVGNTIRSSRSLDLRTNGSAFSVNLDNTSAILAGGTGGSQYVSLYGQGSEKLKTVGSGVTVTGTAYATQFVGGGAGITGISTLNIVNYSGGSGGSGVGNTNNIRTNFLEVSGISTFNGGVGITGDIDSTNLETGTGSLTLGNSSSQFDIRFSPSSGSSPAIRYNVTDGISIYGRYNGGADLLEDVRFGDPSYFKNIIPKADSTYNLGSNSIKWATVYSDNLDVGTGTSTGVTNTPSLTLSHNNPTVAGTSGTTGNIKSIGGAPFYYDGTNWREFVLATGTPVSQPEDTDWDNVILRNDFDTSLTEQRFGQTAYSGSSNVDLVSSPVKVGTKSARIGYPSNGALAYPKRSEYDFTGAWTIEGWFYLDTLPGGTGTTATPLVAHTYTAAYTWGLTVEKSSGYLYFRWLNNSSTTHSYNNTGGRGTQISGAHNVTLLSNAWAHIALVRKSSNGSLHLFVNGTESNETASDQIIDNDIPAFTDSYELWFGKCRVSGTSDIWMDGNIDDIRISTSERYTSNFNAPTTALPISGTGSTTYTLPGSLLGEISLGGSPSWTGTTGVTASQVAAGQYRATFATAYSSATDYVIQTSMNDYTPATTPVGIGVSRFTTHADFFVRRVSDGANIDTGSLAIDLFKK